MDTIINRTPIQEFVFQQCEKIKKILCSHYNIALSEIQKESRKREIVECRQLGIYFSSFYFYGKVGISQSFIGAIFGRPDHATVKHCIKQVSNLVDTDKNFNSKFSIIRDEIEGKITLDFSYAKLESDHRIINAQISFTFKGMDGFQEEKFVYDHQRNILSKFNGNVPLEIINGKDALTEFRKIILSI